MAVNRGEVGSAPRLAALLLDDVDRLAEHAAGRMQKLLPSYAKVPRAQLVPIVRTNMRNVLEAIRDPAADTRRAQANFHTSGETRANQGISSDEMLHGWRIAQDSVHEHAHAHAIVDEHALGADAMLAFLEAMLRWNDAGMRASAEAHRKAELRELTRLAAEQAALRRVATMVAHGSSPEQIFVKVAEEVGQLLGVQAAAIHRYEHDEDTIVGSWGTVREAVVVRCAIIVNGRPWGALDIATAEPDAMPASAESRLNAFTELVATAIANAQARADLAASRARVVAAADEERRRVVRDLHDGAQQRLVLAVMTPKRARGALEHRGPDAVPLLDEALRHAETATDDLRELAHGILPSVLAHGGLLAGVRTLAARMSIPVEIDVTAERLSGAVEAAAYFTIAEALTNVLKHAGAQHAAVTARVREGVLHLSVRDDGVGGADPTGSGIIGLSDRVAALGGTLNVDSPPGSGTIVTASIPTR